MSSRQQFINNVVELLLSQRYVMGIADWQPHTQQVFDAGVERTVTCIMSVTDSRILNNAQFRVTNIDGQVIDFHPEDQDPNILQRGITVEIGNRYKAAIAKGIISV